MVVVDTENEVEDVGVDTYIKANSLMPYHNSYLTKLLHYLLQRRSDYLVTIKLLVILNFDNITDNKTFENAQM